MIAHPTIDHIWEWFKRAVPTPQEKNQSSQLGCHFEEVAEMFEGLEGTTLEVKKLLEETHSKLKELSEHLKQTSGTVVITDRVKVLDSLGDQIVTSVGVGYMNQLNVPSGLIEIDRSNWSKFDEYGQPILDPVTHKITKGPNYSPPELWAFV